MYKMRIYHRNAVKKDKNTGEYVLDRNIIESALNTSVGHSIVELDDGEKQIARGLYPSNLYKNEKTTIEDSKTYQSEHPDEKIFHVIEIDISEAQYQKAMQYMEKFEPYVNKNIPKEVLGGMYKFIGYNCSDFSNSVYKAAGLPVNFTYQYTAHELAQIPGAVATYIQPFGVGDKPHKVLSNLSLEEFAAEQNVPASSLSVAKNTGPSMKPSPIASSSAPKYIYTIAPNSRLKQSASELEELQLVSGLCDKIKSGATLDTEVCNRGVEIAQRYFDVQHHTSSDDAYKYNYEFVTGIGEIGQFSNKMLLNNCVLQGIKGHNAKCDYSKILLAGYDIEATKKGVKMTPDVSDAMRINSFKDVGIDAKADLKNFVATFDNKKAATYDSVNQIIEIVKPNVEFVNHESGVISLHARDSQKSRDVNHMKALSSFQHNVKQFFQLPEAGNQVSANTFIDVSDKQLASKLATPGIVIKRKYASSASDHDIASHADKFGSSLNVYSVSQDDKDSSSRDVSYGVNSSKGQIINDPSFVVKMANASVALISPENIKKLDKSAVSSGSSKTTVQHEVNNNKLRVEIGPKVHEKHESMEQEDLNQLWKNGVAAYGSFHEVVMPPNILNGDGAANVRPAAMVTNSWRPGAQEKSSFKTDYILHELAERRAEESRGNFAHIPTLKNVAAINRCKINSFDELNIDPLVIDFGNKGFELSSWERNNVLFDMQGDGFLYETGWITGQTGLLVMPNKGEVNTIYQLVSEKFLQKQYKDGFSALSEYDLNHDGIIDKNDEIYSQLRVWFDPQGNGDYKNGNIKTLSELGVEKIHLQCDLDSKMNGRSLNGNLIKSISHITMENGTKHSIAAVDFIANTSRHKFERSELGVKIVSTGSNHKLIENDAFQKIKIEDVQRETSSFVASDENASVLQADEYGVENLIAGKKTTKLIGNAGDNWLIGNPYKQNQYEGISGDNNIVINEHDKESDINPGPGFNTVFINSGRSRYFDPTESGVSVVYASRHGDIIDAHSTGNNCFIKAQSGHSILRGGRAYTVIAGGAEDDLLIGGEGGAIARANKGNNILVGGDGNNILESGIGFNYLKGGSSNNVFKCNAKGYVICNGKSGDFNVVELSGSIYDFKMEYNNEGDVVVRNKNYYEEFCAVLINVHYINFSDINQYSYNFVLPRKWKVPSQLVQQSVVSTDDFFRDAFTLKDKKVSFLKIIEAQNCSVTTLDGQNLLEMQPLDLYQLDKFRINIDPNAKGAAYIKYAPHNGVKSAKFTYHTSKEKGQKEVSDIGCSIAVFSGDVLRIGNYFIDESNINEIYNQNITGAGLTVQIGESSSEHSDGIKYILRKILPKAKLVVSDVFVSANKDLGYNVDIINMSVTYHSPLRINMEYDRAI